MAKNSMRVRYGKQTCFFILALCVFLIPISQKYPAHFVNKKILSSAKWNSHPLFDKGSKTKATKIKFCTFLFLTSDFFFSDFHWHKSSKFWFKAFDDCILLFVIVYPGCKIAFYPEERKYILKNKTTWSVWNKPSQCVVMSKKNTKHFFLKICVMFKSSHIVCYLYIKI